ncbi:MAG: cation-transporting P-type ATPase [Anaerolineae bacterium]
MGHRHKMTVNTMEALHTLNVTDVYPALETTNTGLSQTEAQARLGRYGTNAIREVKGKPIYIKLAANFTHLMALLLWAGGIMAFIGQMPQLGVAIWAVNLINGAFSFWQEYRAEKATEALKRLLPTYALVLRDDQQQKIPAEELVPGDIILLAEGDHISADARLVEAAELRIDQSTLSGESHPVRKVSEAVLQQNLARVEMPNLIFAGTNVAAGTGKAVVFATGMNTEFGKIAGLTQSVGEELSPLQVEMKQVTKTVSVIAVVVGVVFFFFAILMAGIDVAQGFIFAVGMIVAFVPEGLLPTVTLSLAMGVQRMAKRNALVKRLSAVETLGCTSVICTDKTGTLTQNEMTVCNLWVAGQRWEVTGTGYEPKGQITNPRDAGNSGAITKDVRRVLLGAALCNNARVLPPTADGGRWSILGDPTEAALRVVAMKAGLNLEEEAGELPRLREIPFESRRKCMSTIHRSGSQRIAYVKGAPKEVLALCTHIEVNNEERLLDDAQRGEIMQANDDYARTGLRVLAVAARVLPPNWMDYNAENVECDLTFLGLLAMMDPPRVEVAEAVKKCHQAGIRITMITGDYGLTAESVARRIGIVRSEHPRIVTGAELETMSDETLREVVHEEVIFARVAPEHKLRVVNAYQANNKVVAVTGDGVNDAPALKKADIGVAMGITGTDVAKEAADMILTDDNFASIVNAIEEGRAAYANIKKFTTYIFTSNTPEAVPFILFALSRARIPLALDVMQILAIDLGTDMMPALALGAELPEPGIMQKTPRNLGEHVITRDLLLRAYIWLGLLQGAVAMIAFYFMYWTNGYWGQLLDLPATGTLYRAAVAMALGSVVATQIGNVFAQRTERVSIFHIGLFSNRLILWGILTELVLIGLIVYVPLFQQIFGTGAFPLENWLLLFLWTPSLVIVDETRKAFLRWQERKAAS